MPTEKDLKRYTYTTGAHITPIFYEGKWVWMITEFDDDTFCAGDLIAPDTTADSIKQLGTKFLGEE